MQLGLEDTWLFLVSHSSLLPPCTDQYLHFNKLWLITAYFTCGTRNHLTTQVHSHLQSWGNIVFFFFSVVLAFVSTQFHTKWRSGTSTLPLDNRFVSSTSQRENSMWEGGSRRGLKTWPWFDSEPAGLCGQDRNRSVSKYFPNLLFFVFFLYY